ncbi:helix-turn-helix transcriptional regulator [Streptomyces sp. NBC_01381]|uniref:helix-turn-helix domain-containing protein n=1 Tax=Streptomyces sp. NBC_01381 TaxID=2903845 RepID=UPI00224CFFC6|nr:helix-turn-helix transcriptional regulator [Streptomyces sp. NBC_01381]MCX4670622.1 helix-turn-helix transcriptional regulator [Streptomyces sp. NBC_01381]
MSESGDELAQRVAVRLERLFQNVIPARLGRPWTNREVSEATGVAVGRIAGLRRGRPLEPLHRDPPQEHISARFTDRLNHLLAQRVDEQGQRYSLRAAARASGMSSTYLDKLLEGRSQPTLSKLAPLAAFLRIGIDALLTDDLGSIAHHFGVRREALTYDSSEPVVIELEDTLKALAAYRRIAHNPAAVQIAFRMAGLPPGQASEVAAAVESLLADPDPSPHDAASQPPGPH